jgi:hypothetical protein
MAPPPYPLGGEARDVVEDVARLGGFGIAAHPDSAKPELRWDGWDAPVDALEWFNADSQWRDEQRWRLLPTILHYSVRPSEAVTSLFDRPAGMLRRWDEIASRRRVIGLAAADAHARMGLGGKTDPYDRLVYVKLPSYEAVFRAFSLRVELHAPFSGDAGIDAAAVLEALRAGRVSTVFDGVAGPGVLRFSAESGGKIARQGGALTVNGPVRLRVQTNGPPQASLLLLRDGEVVGRADGPTLEWDGDRPGAYRVEAHLPGAPGEPRLPWIVSNPIYVGSPGVWPAADALPPATARMVWPAGSWHVEKDARSKAQTAMSTEAGLIRRTLRYELARDEPSPFVALVTPDVGAMRDATRIGFRAAAGRPMRLSVQVRLVDGPAVRRWQRSVYLSTEPRDIAIRFQDMRVVGSGARDTFAPERSHSLLFVVDTVNAKPGDGGVLWIEGLRTER